MANRRNTSSQCAETAPLPGGVRGRQGKGRFAFVLFLVQAGLSLASAICLAASHDLPWDDGVLASFERR